MYKKLLFIIVLISLVVFIVACQTASHGYVLGDVLLTEDFANDEAWETLVAGNIDLQVTDGVYRVQTGPGGYIWGLNSQEHSDVVIEVEVTQLSAYEDNSYGVICRADPLNTGDGYYFLISGDGLYAIGRGEGDEDDGKVNKLVNWAPHSAINTGQAENAIRAVCIGDYLALYVNDQFVAEVEDSSYSSGYAGLAAAVFRQDGVAEEINVDIAFDNLTISAASLSN